MDGLETGMDRGITAESGTNTHWKCSESGHLVLRLNLNPVLVNAFLLLKTFSLRPSSRLTTPMPLSSADLAALRQDYAQRGLRRAELDSDPIHQFQKWLGEAIDQQLLEPNAMVLATVDVAGQPWSRTVLLKACD